MKASALLLLLGCSDPALSPMWHGDMPAGVSAPGDLSGVLDAVLDEFPCDIFEDGPGPIEIARADRGKYVECDRIPRDMGSRPGVAVACDGWAEVWINSSAPDSAAGTLILHELGHVAGLRHTRRSDSHCGISVMHPDVLAWIGSAGTGCDRPTFLPDELEALSERYCQ